MPSASLIPAGDPTLLFPPPAWCPSSPSSWASRPRRVAASPAARSPFAPPTSTRWATTSTSPSSRCWATSASATTSSRTPWPSPGTSAPDYSAWSRSACTSPSTWTTTKPTTSGITKSASRPSESTATATAITGGGRPAWKDPPAPAPSCTTTAARRRASASTVKPTR